MRSFVFVFFIPILSAAQADELADFQAFVKRCDAAYAARPSVETVYSAAAKSWVKRVHAPAKITYDVKKTDSLVSPFAAYIETTEVSAAERAADEAAAKLLDVNLNGYIFRFTTTMTFAYREGRWTMTGARETSASRKTAGQPFGEPSTYLVAMDSLLKRDGPIQSCFSPG